MAAWLLPALSLAQAAYGAYQNYQGSHAEKGLKRPTYQIPDEVRQKLSNAQLMALEGLPEAQKQQYVQNVQRATSFGLRNLSDRKAGIAGLSGLVQNEQDAYNKMLAMDSAQRLENQKYLGSVQSEMGGFKDKAFQINELDPYQQKSQAAAAMKGAGLQNIYGGIQGGINAYGQGQLTDALKGLNGISDKKSIDAITGAVTGIGNVGGVNPMAQTGTTGLGSVMNAGLPAFASGTFGLADLRKNNPQLANLSDEELLKLIGGR